VLTVILGGLAKLEKEHDIKPFFNAVRKFYVASIAMYTEDDTEVSISRPIVERPGVL